MSLTRYPERKNVAAFLRVLFVAGIGASSPVGDTSQDVRRPIQ